MMEVSKMKALRPTRFGRASALSVAFSLSLAAIFMSDLI